MHCAKVGLSPHMHIIGDDAAEMTLDALDIMRVCCPDTDIRPGMARNDLMSPHQYRRFAEPGVVANLSFQWAGLPEGLPETYRHLLGHRRAENGLETHGKFFDAGVIVAYNSDWPIDPLNIWGNLQVGLTRWFKRTFSNPDTGAVHRSGDFMNRCLHQHNLNTLCFQFFHNFW
ncbi:amidohydrolase family protein [Salmonella enterica]|nr:amidohydrolase family protein [Salmonella enterica]